jgi:hypothetical protein
MKTETADGIDEYINAIKPEACPVHREHGQFVPAHKEAPPGCGWVSDGDESRLEPIEESGTDAVSGEILELETALSAREVNAAALGVVKRLMGFITNRVEIKPGCEKILLRRLVASIWCCWPDLLEGNLTFRKLALRAGFSLKQIKNGEADHLLSNPEHVQVEAPSLTQLARQIGIAPSTLATETGRFSREFGVVSHQQSHAWNRKESNDPSRN